jgi:predicted 3-demethylubiquinone-9 3-methyltransferase (glyoxalase superfamily)
MNIQKVTPFLWFNSGAADAATYYTSIFKNSKIIGSNPMVTTLEIEGLRIMILNGGPTYKLSEAFSLSISCENQEEIDYYWSKLSEGGKEGRCGWLVDKFGLSWQVVPAVLPKLMSDPAKSQRVIAAFMKMNKFDIEKLLQA